MSQNLHYAIYRAVSYSLVVLMLLTGLIAGAGTALADSPDVSIEAPSHEIGDAGAAMGDVWNGSSVNEVKWTQPDAGGNTIDISTGQTPGAFGGAIRGEAPEGKDLATAFHATSDVGIPTHIYKYVTYRAKISDISDGDTGAEADTNGRVLFSTEWGSNWFYDAFPYRRTSKEYSRVPPLGNDRTACDYDDWCIYFIDLTRNDIDGGAPNNWDWGQSNVKAKAFGFWFHENWQVSGGDAPSGKSPDWFEVDYVYLTGDIVATDTYTIKWNVADNDGGTITSTVYYQELDELQLPQDSPTCNAGSLGSWTPVDSSSISVAGGPSLPNKYYLPIILKMPAGGSDTDFGSGVIGAYNQSYALDVSNDNTFEPGKMYYICIVAEDPDGNRTYKVSSAPVIKVPDDDIIIP
jgi:hypothetical protein